MEVITTHINADFDCLGAMLAASKLYPKALLSFPGAQEKAVRNFIEQYPDYIPTVVRAKDIDLEKITRLIIVDCQHSDRIGRFSQLLNRQGVEIHIYDHHPISEGNISATRSDLRQYGASATILARILMKKSVKLTPAEATVIMLAIHEDTGRLLFPSTTYDDYLAAAWLMQQGAKLNVITDALSQELNSQQMWLLKQLLGSLKTTNINGIKISIAHASSDQYIGDIALLAHVIRDMENLDALFLVVSMEQRIYIVARSRLLEVNAGEILRRFNGGGHATAASASVKDQSLFQTLERLEEWLRIEISPQNNAGSIMSTPVKTMPDDTSINGARELLTRYNCNAMPVISAGQMIGIISRKIVEKALHHNLGDAAVTDFMHSEFMRATTKTGLSEIQAYMVEGNRRFVPVFKENKLSGVVTRTDLLRQMHGGRRGETGAIYDVDALGFSPKYRFIDKQITKQLPQKICKLLQDLGAVADQLGLKIHAVGGFVRDLLLKVENLDIDVTVEGDGIFFAEQFAARHGCRVRSHKTFNTAVLIFPDESKVDVASTRLEFYESPGVLPTVERSSLRNDLYRRDFTINTLAVCINSEHFGRLTDYFGGQQDLQEQVIRVLHNLSFVEDPTRVFRAIRFEQRLGFRLLAHTESLIQNAVKMQMLDKIGGTRLLNELIQIMREKEPVKAITRMSELGLLASIHPALKLTQENRRVIEETGHVLAWFRLLYLKERYEQWQIYFLALSDQLRQDEFMETCRRLNIPNRIITKVFEQRQRALFILKTVRQRVKLAEPIRNSEIYSWFQGISLETLLYMTARTNLEETKRFISLYITQLSKVCCSLNGNALLAEGLLPGPEYRQIMNKLLIAKLDQELKSEQEELEMAKKLIFQLQNAASNKG